MTGQNEANIRGTRVPAQLQADRATVLPGCGLGLQGRYGQLRIVNRFDGADHVTAPGIYRRCLSETPGDVIGDSVE